MIDGLREMILIPVNRIFFNVKLGLKDQNIARQRTNSIDLLIIPKVYLDITDIQSRKTS